MFFVVIKVLIFDTYAFAAAPVAAEALIELFGPLLVASGINTQEEVDDMSWGEVSSGVQDGLNNGTINPADIIVSTTVNGVEIKMNLMKWFADRAAETAAVADVVDAVRDAWWNSLTQDDVIPTYLDVDLNGYGAKMVVTYYYNDKGFIIKDINNVTDYSKYRRYTYYFDYATYLDKTNGFEMHFTDNILVFKESGSYYSSESSEYYTTTSIKYKYYDGCTILDVYGDIRYADDTPFEDLNDETANYVGETADGQPVTLEQIQSGEIPLDDVIIDWEKLDETSLIELMKLIIIELEQVPVIEDDTSTFDDVKEDIQDITGELDIAEFNNLQMPSSIIDVFPFCLPFDFVRGMKLLVAEPKVPHFEVDINVPSFLGVPEQKWTFVIDLKDFEPLAKITRWCSTLAFGYVLIFLSTKIVKGAGA